MRLTCGVVVLLAAAFVAGRVAAVDLPPVPTLPTPTLPAPPLPPLPPPPTVPALPTVPTPTVPAPTVPAPTPPVPAPTVPAPAPAPAPAPSAPAQPRPAPTSTQATARPTATPAAAPGTHTASPVRTQPAASPSGATARRAHARLATPRPVVARFHVAKAGRLHVRVLELAPRCRRLRGFVVDAERGSNTLRLPKRITTLGTYLLTGRRAGRTVFTFRARLLRGRHVKLGGGENTCIASIETAVDTIHVLPKRARQGQIFRPPPRQRASAAPKAIGSSPRNPSPLVRAVTLNDAPTALRPVLLVLLALSIVLLGAAALPQRALPAGPVAALIATKRAYIAAAGIWLLAIVAVVTTFA